MYTTAQILALPTQNNTRLVKSYDGGKFYAIEKGEDGTQAQSLGFSWSSFLYSANLGYTYKVASVGYSTRSTSLLA
jgi:hypothetical protein